MPALARILLVEDEPSIAASVRYQLVGAGYAVDIVADGAQAAETDLDDYDLAVLDLLLPGLPGDEVCRRWRSRSTVPVLMLTARTDVTARVLGLEVGADDYLGKPFAMPELLARIRAILRRRDMDRDQPVPTSVDVAGLHLDLIDRRVTVDGRRISLTTTEFRLLALLVSRPEHPFTRHDISRHLWSRDCTTDDRTCDTHVKNLRHKIEEDPMSPQRVVSVRGVGYMLRAE